MVPQPGLTAPGLLFCIELILGGALPIGPLADPLFTGVVSDLVE